MFENLALRQQINVLQRGVSRPAVRDRLFLDRAQPNLEQLALGARGRET